MKIKPKMPSLFSTVITFSLQHQSKAVSVHSDNESIPLLKVLQDYENSFHQFGASCIERWSETTTQSV